MIYADCWKIVFDDSELESYRMVHGDHDSAEIITLTDSVFEFLDRTFRAAVFLAIMVFIPEERKNFNDNS